MTRSCSKCGRDISTDPPEANYCRNCSLAIYGTDIHAKGRNGGFGPLPEPKAKDERMQGQAVADLIERYCQVRERFARELAAGFTDAKERHAAAKAELAAGLDAAFTEMIPQAIDDLV